MMLKDLKIPTTNGVPSALDSLSQPEYTSIAARHASFLLEEQRFLSASKCYALALKELKVISILLPSEYETSTVLALAAWFHYACFFDDVIESLPPSEVHSTLQQCRSLLATNWAELVSDTIAPLDESSMAIHMTQNLLVQFSHCLGPKISNPRFAACIETIWTGFEEEAEFFEQESKSVEAYLRFRRKTISLNFIFAVLASDLDICPAEQVARDLEALEHSVSLVVGFQNDLVGLGKDVEQGKMSNFVLVYCDEMMGVEGDLEPGVQAGVRRHNQEVTRCEVLLDGILISGCEAEATYARKVFGLVANHYRWVTAAKRYKGST